MESTFVQTETLGRDVIETPKITYTTITSGRTFQICCLGKV